MPEIKRLTKGELMKSAFTGTFEKILRGGHPCRETAISDDVNGVTVDTVLAPDTNLWETAIVRVSNIVVVDQYHTEEEARKGHLEWIEKMKVDPDRELKDVVLPETNTG